MHRKILVLANSSSGLYDFRKELLSELGKKCEIVISVPEYDKVPELEEKGFEVKTLNEIEKNKEIFKHKYHKSG